MAVETERQETSQADEPVRDAFRAAFDAAVKEHTPAPETPAKPAKAEKAASKPAVAVEEPEAEETEEEPEADEPGETEETEDEGGTEDETGLISDKEFTDLQTKFKDDPAALRKSLEGAFTKKTQALAEERHSVERLQQYAPLIDAYEDDPEGTLQRLAELNGFELVTPGQERKPAATTTTDAARTATVDAALAEFKASLGEDLSYLGDAMAPALKKFLEGFIVPTIEAQVKPLKDQAQTMSTREAERETSSIMESFDKQYPDWKEHETEMTALAQRLSPNGMSEADYLALLYKTVTRDNWEKTQDARIEKQVTDRLKKRIAKMDGPHPEPVTRSVPESVVRPSPPSATPTFGDAYAAAKRGERWD